MRNNLIIFIIMITTMSSCGGCREYIRQQEMMDKKAKGEGDLLEAESSKKIQIESARGENEAANMKAEAKIKRAKAENEAMIIQAEGWAKAEIKRAEGIAEANKIIGSSLRDNPEYIKYLQIEAILNSKGSKIYIPTEAGLPILEAK